MNIYIGNLSSNVTDEDLKDNFAEYGKVKSAKVIKDMFSGVSKGFGFVEMFSDTEGQKAIDELNAADLDGKKIVVNEARPKTDKGRGGRSSGGNSGGGRQGGGNRRGW
ncbi:MAG: RNA-binding protein [Melioribacteraceae bacterium]|nr:RNA-binding protein [Melioribacteraceae bacterium]MCF8265482.1 RNA-binding protein [Melioribacteraceae bacterium]MCF8413451.1 RNA-binding protein [Melioribacteraceae bacterium]MCF8431683.1 RNA-binding protein [Melioribacteraceae bacterium]